MGGAHSLTNLQKSVSSVVTENVNRSLQSVNQTDILLQQVLLYCNQAVLSAGEEFVKCQARWKSPVLCDPIWSVLDRCRIANVDMSQVANVQLNAEQAHSLDLDLQQNLQNRIRSDLQAQYGLLQFSNEVVSSVAVLAQQSVAVVTENLQQTLSSIQGRQTIEVAGGTAELVTQKQSLEAINDMFQKSAGWIDARNAVASAVRISIQDQTRTLRLVFAIGAGVLLGAALIVFLIWFLRRRR